MSNINPSMCSEWGSGLLLQWPSGKESAYDAGDIGDVSSIPGWQDPLEEGMTTHSSILTWKIPRTEELGGLWSMGSQKLDMTKATEHIHM